MKKSWKTSLGGLLTAFGVALQGSTEIPYAAEVGKILTILGPLIVGMYARDNNVTSEAAGAHQKKE